MSCVLELEPVTVPDVSKGPEVVCRIDPREDPRWKRFLEKHARASVFHSAEWLESLWRTYDYEPVAYTTSSDDGTGQRNRSLSGGEPAQQGAAWFRCHFRTTAMPW